MLKNYLALILVIVTSLFFYNTVSAEIDPTLQNFAVDGNWEDEGISDNLISNDFIYVDGTNQTGSWTSFIQEEDKSRIINVFVEGDPRNGDVSFIVNAWSDQVEGDPDEQYLFELNENELDVVIEDAVDYDFFEFRIEIDDQGGPDTRPNVNSFEAVFERDTGVGLIDLFLVAVIFGAFIVFLRSF